VKSRLRILRAGLGWTQEQLAETVGVSRQAINALETERHDPSLDLAYRVAAAFGLRVEEIFPNPHEEGPRS
jgi:putative transcriptional regulator